MRGCNYLQHNEDVLWVQLRPNAAGDSGKIRATAWHSHICLYVHSSLGKMYVCMCARAALVLLGFTEKVLWPCQSRGYSPASGEGSGAQILHYGLIHHLWDSLAPLSIPVAPTPPSPSNLIPHSFLQMHQSFAHLPHYCLLISRHLRGCSTSHLFV